MRIWQQIRNEAIDSVGEIVFEIGANLFGELLSSLVAGIFDGL
jgi:hypothetical protein